MIIRDKSPPILPSSYATVIGRNDNQRNLIGYACIEKDSQFSYVTVCEHIYKNTRLCCRYTKVNKYIHYILQINHSL